MVIDLTFEFTPLESVEVVAFVENSPPPETRASILHAEAADKHESCLHKKMTTTVRRILTVQRRFLLRYKTWAPCDAPT